MTKEVTEARTTLANAPIEIKLAVDLIQLLEETDVELETTISALEIALKDFKNKRAHPISE
ncbi:DUF2496 domain-containing protein [Psychromonas sp. GE-S-Ul-11]|uniref:DUF2496 domain-containing protein n=1 Tax=unclassified Psychromonas TaxID=2614957 RepID=UPI00390CA49B